MGLLLSGKNPAAYKTAERTTFTATAGQTTFTVPVGYNVGDIDVYLNGIRLIDNDDFYASNGTTVVLASGANLGDSLVVVCYYNFVSSSSYTKAETDARYVGFGSTSPMTTYLRTPNYGVSSYSDSAFASLEASPGLGTQGVGIKASGRSMATTGGELTYVSDTRGVSGAHKFYGWNGTSLTNFGGFDSSGRPLSPNRTAFMASISADLAVTNGWNKFNLVNTFTNVHYNIGGNYSSSNARFTAPVTGLYSFSGGVGTNGGTPASSYLGFEFYVNGTRNYSGWNYKSSGYQKEAYTRVFYLNSGDYVEPGYESAQSFTAFGSTTTQSASTYFSGFLIG